MRFSKKLAMVTAIWGACHALPSFADFCVDDQDVYDPCYKFPVRENYGNGQSCRFRRSINGYILSAEEQAALACYLPIREDQRFYGRLAVGSSAYTLGSLKNRATIFPDSTGQIVKQSANKSNPVVEIAVGYVASPTFRYEFEYIANRNFTYTANPVLSYTAPVVNGVPVTLRSFTSIITVNPFLVNLYYDFKWFERFRPYVMGGVGGSINTINTTVSPVPTNTTSTTESGQKTVQLGSFVWCAGVGFRVRVFSHWYVDAKIRYINMGLMKMRATSNFEIEGIFSQTPATLGILYLF